MRRCASAERAARQTGDGIERNPLAAIAGGLAIGAIVAALIPRTAREDKLAGNVGRKVRATASKAATTARETAKNQLDELGVNEVVTTLRDVPMDAVLRSFNSAKPGDDPV